MTEQLDHKTFDLVAVLAGRDYPTIDVPLYFNEKLGFEIYQLEKQRNRTFDEGEARKLDEQFDVLAKRAESEKYTALLKAIPEQVRRDIYSKVNEEFPTKKDLLGREEQNPEADTSFTKRLWAVYIQKITAPDGSTSSVDETAVEALYANAPTTVHEALNSGISELQTGARAGFESAAKEVNFLSDASPEG